MAAKRVVLVDGSWLIYRAFFALPATFKTAAGLPTNASYGFATMFRKMFSARKPDLGAVVFDHPSRTKREEKFPAYKAQRPPAPDMLRPQFDTVREIVETNGFPRVEVAGYEADDIIGTLALEAAKLGHEVVIVAGDKDLAQLIGDDIRMQDTMRDVTFDADLVQKKWGVPPARIPDLLALMGDSVDNIPGVPGIGQKGASTLIGTYGSLESIYEHLGEIKGKTKALLEQHRDVAFLSRELATIDTHAVLPSGIDELRIRVPDAKSLNHLYKELEFYSLLTEDNAAEATAAREMKQEVLSAGEVDEWLGGSTAPFAVAPIYDLGPQVSAVTARWAGVALSDAHGKLAYLPVAHSNAKNDIAALKPFFQNAQVPKLAHDAKALFVALSRVGIELRGVVFDTQLASFLIEPEKVIPHRIEHVVREYLHETLPAEKSIRGAGQGEQPFHALPVADVSSYAVHRASVITRLHPDLEKRVETLAQREQLERDLELSWVLARMEISGMLVDGANLAALGSDFEREKGEVEERIYTHAGKRFNIGSTKQLAEVLFSDLKLPVVKKTKTGFSTDSDVLETLAPKHDIARELLRHRTLAKLLNTYVDVLQASVVPETGRVHTTIQQTTGVSGRLICTDPDLQRTPVKTAEGKRIREAFIAPPGRRIVSADWSQIELRVLAHFSNDAKLIAAFSENADVHRRTAAELFSVEPDAVTKAQRNVGKTVNFATIYGQGATALGQILGIPRSDAKRYIDRYFELYSGVRAPSHRPRSEPDTTRNLTTLLGRYRFIPELLSHNDTDRQAGRRIAANTPIQGSAADLCKLAMLDIAARLTEQNLDAHMILQVHDELVFEVAEKDGDSVQALVKERMENVRSLRVPLVADVGIGLTWAAAH